MPFPVEYAEFVDGTRWYSTEDVAHLAGVTVESLYKYRQRPSCGLPNPERFGRILVWYRPDIDRWVKERRKRGRKRGETNDPRDVGVQEVSRGLGRDATGEPGLA